MTGRRLTRVPLRAPDADVVVVGSGVAGLAAAARLTAAGRLVRVLEASPVAGGRVGSALHDGFAVDEGLHLLDAAAAWPTDLVDPAALDLRPLDPTECLVDGQDDPVRLGDDAVPATGLPATGPLAAGLPRLVAPALPSHGLVALTVQLTARLDSPVVTGAHVEVVRRHGGSWQVVGDHGTWTTGQVVLAVPPGEATHLLHGTRIEHELAHPDWLGTTTWWLAPEAAPSPSRSLRMDARRAPGPVAATVVVTNVAPRYSEDGRTLVAAAVPHRGGRPLAGEAAVRAHLSELWGTAAFDWPVVARQDHRRAVPVPAPTPDAAGPLALELAPGLVLAGDHLAPGVTGALASGDAAAQVLLA